MSESITRVVKSIVVVKRKKKNWGEKMTMNRMYHRSLIIDY